MDLEGSAPLWLAVSLALGARSALGAVIVEPPHVGPLDVSAADERAIECLDEARTGSGDCNYAVAAAMFRALLAYNPNSGRFSEWIRGLAVSKTKLGELDGSPQLKELAAEVADGQEEAGRRFFVLVLANELWREFGGVVDRSPYALVEGSGGGRVPEYVLDAAHLELIRACDDWAVEPAATEGGDAALVSDMIACQYVPAHVLYNYGHYEEFRLRCGRLIEQHPDRPEALYCAGLIVASFQSSGDLTGAQAAAAKYSYLFPGLSY